jgi:predicted nucleic acid-binding protein
VNILDTDALSHHMKMNSMGRAIEVQIAASEPDFVITAVSAFETIAGAAELYEKLQKRRRDLIAGFNLVKEVVKYLGRWRGRILPYDTYADQIYLGFTPRLRQELGNDARIAAIARAQGAGLWTLNVHDFKQVSGLVVVEADTGKVI